MNKTLKAFNNSMRGGNSTADCRLSFEAYGVKIGLRLTREAYAARVAKRLSEILPNGYAFIEDFEAEHIIRLTRDDETGDFQIFKDGENVSDAADEADIFRFLDSQIRLTVAEYAVGKVFLHAGAVVWNGKAVIIPASSFSGKTTLVAELIERGAEYYSDEYAVLDGEGLVYPYPKMLSLRGIIDEYEQLDCPAESFGAKTGTEAVPVGLILICRFEKSLKNGNRLNPEILSAGQGMLEVLAHTIPIRHNPKFALSVLNKISTRAIIAKTRQRRGEGLCRTAD